MSIMSGFEAEFERLRREVEDSIKRFLDLVETHSSRVSEIQRKAGLEEATPGLWEFLKEVKGLRSEARRELAETRGRLVRELRVFRDRLRDASLAEPGRRDELREAFNDLRGFFEDRFDEAEDKLEEFLDMVEDVEDEIRDRIRELKKTAKKEVYALGLGVSEAPKLAVAKLTDVKLPDIGKLIEESLSKAFSGASMIVSSVRLPRVDLDLIDALVEAGIFKSRNEGIAFFAHKGIEASKDWLMKVKEKLEDIKRLQEETKRELEKMLGESSGKGGEEKD
jgi:Arc/MetJ-type ribon-helix-helix transcriptional regulator